MSLRMLSRPHWVRRRERQAAKHDGQGQVANDDLGTAPAVHMFKLFLYLSFSCFYFSAGATLDAWCFSIEFYLIGKVKGQTVHVLKRLKETIHRTCNRQQHMFKCVSEMMPLTFIK